MRAWSRAEVLERLDQDAYDVEDEEEAYVPTLSEEEHQHMLDRLKDERRLSDRIG